MQAIRQSNRITNNFKLKCHKAKTPDAAVLQNFKYLNQNKNFKQ